MQKFKEPLAKPLGSSILPKDIMASKMKLIRHLVQAQSSGSTAELYWNGIPQDEQTIRLRDAILNMVDMIVRAYDDPEITAFFAKGRGPW